MKLFDDPAQCSGCGACVNSCPVHCITMVQDREGFLYPEIDQIACTDCGICAAVCGQKYQNRQTMPQAYALYHKDRSIVQVSTSGGAFTAVCQAFCDGEYAIFGAVQDDALSVYHRYVTDLAGLSLFRKTKYVQSNTNKTYTEAEAFLDAGRKVLFSGTPCQIAGLRSFLRKEYKNLLTVGVICHGVGSPLVYRKYIEYLEKKYRSKLIRLDFRDKDKHGWEGSEIKAVFKNRRVYRRFSLTYDDPYMIGYLSCLSVRPFCFSCPFASVPRVADFTVGDLWGADTIVPDMDSSHGLSVLLANSQKAKDMLPDIARIAYMEEVSLPAVAGYNLQLREPPVKNPDRDMFIDAVRRTSFEEVIKRYLKPRPIANRLATRFISKNVRNKIKAIKTRGQG